MKGRALITGTGDGHGGLYLHGVAVPVASLLGYIVYPQLSLAAHKQSLVTASGIMVPRRLKPMEAPSKTANTTGTRSVLPPARTAGPGTEEEALVTKSLEVRLLFRAPLVSRP